MKSEIYGCILGLSLFLIFGCTTALDVEQSDWVKENLVGNVKKIIEEQYKPLGESSDVVGKENLGLRQKTIHVFNEKGLYEELSFTLQGGKIRDKSTLEYNDKWQLIKQKHFKGIDSLPITTDEYKYDETGEIVEQTYYEQDQYASKTIFEFDKEKGIKTGRVYNQKGNVSSVQIFQYDDQGNVVTDSKYNRDNESLSYKNYNRYDKEGHLSSIETYQPVGNNFSISKLNKQGKEIEVLKYRDGLIASSCMYGYDNNGNQTDVSCDIYEDLIKRTIRSTIKYDFDEQGNWTRKVTFQEGIVTYVVERTYIYF